jgi:hypothetical protein
MIEYEVVHTDTPRWQETDPDGNWRIKRWRWTLFGHEEGPVVRQYNGSCKLPANWETAT